MTTWLIVKPFNLRFRPKWMPIGLNVCNQVKLWLEIDRTVISALILRDRTRTILTGRLLFTKIIWLFASLVDIFPPLGMQSRGALRQTTRRSVNWGGFDVTYILVVVINCPGFSSASCHWLCVSRLDSQKKCPLYFIFSVCYPVTFFFFFYQHFMQEYIYISIPNKVSKWHLSQALGKFWAACQVVKKKTWCSEQLSPLVFFCPVSIYFKHFQTELSCPVPFKSAASDSLRRTIALWDVLLPHNTGEAHSDGSHV